MASLNPGGPSPEQLDAEATAFLESVFPAPFNDYVGQRFTSGLPPEEDEVPCWMRPHVTLTFAQSADGKIAGEGGSQLALSGEASFIMTHRMRVMHDGIMIGVGTLLNDDPQLNARKLPRPPKVGALPTPIILDSKLRSPLHSRVLHNFLNGTGTMPLLMCDWSVRDTPKGYDHFRTVSKSGYNVCMIEAASGGRGLDWPATLQHLYRMGYRRIMIEGGASVIQSLLTAALDAKAREEQLIDSLIITVAPKLVGPKGLGYSIGAPQQPSIHNPMVSSFLSLPGLVHRKSQLFGDDVVFAWGRRP